MRYATALLVVVVVTGLASSGFGHPPSDVTAHFDTGISMLTVTVMHTVNDANKHYVDEIEVELNGKKVIEQKFARQIDTNTQEAIYRIIDAAPGDKIKVTAACNISGKQRVEITVEEPEEEKQAGSEEKQGEIED